MIQLGEKNMIIDFLDDESLFYCWNPYIFKFETNSMNFRIKMELYNKSSNEFPHFGITAREGIAILFRIKGKKHWYNLDAYARKTDILINMKPLIDNNQKYEVLIYGPTLSYLSKFIIEIPNEYYAKKISNKTDKSILICGGMQSVGFGCTTLGVTFSSILTREFESNLYKLVSTNKNYMLKLYNFILGTPLLPQSDVGILEINFDSNDEANVKYFLEILKYLKKFCKKIICWFTIPKTKSEQRIITDLLKNDIITKKIIIKDLSFVYDKKFSDFCTLNNELINDTGNILIYKEMKKNIMEIMKWNI